MYRSRLVPCILVVALVVASCDDPTSAPHIVPTDLGPAFSLQDASAGGSAGFYFLPPLVPNPAYGGVADMERSPRVDICEVGNDECTQVKTFSGSDILTEDEHYKVEWDAGASDAKVGVPYRIQVSLGLVTLGSTDVVFEAGGNARRANSSQEVGVNRTVPIRFRIEEGALASAVEASECDVDVCDVVEGNTHEEITTTVRDRNAGDRVAGFVRIPEQTGALANTQLLVVLKLLAGPIAGANIPTDDQIPYFLQVEVFGPDGDPVTDEFDPKAYLALCQPPEVVSGLIPFLSIFRFSDGTTEILDTTRNAPECFAGNDHTESASLPLLQRMQRGVSRVAGFFRAQPLRALHGGLHTTTPLFSEFGAVMDEDEVPFGIISPEAGEVVFPPTLSLLGYDLDAAGNNAQWAVRLNTCASSAGAATRAGNVDGQNDGFTWEDGVFTAEVDITDTERFPPSTGEEDFYCFVLNTQQGSASGNRFAQQFKIGEAGPD